MTDYEASKDYEAINMGGILFECLKTSKECTIVVRGYGPPGQRPLRGILRMPAVEWNGLRGILGMILNDLS